ncbi:MAG: HAD family phosphatase, partial [Bacteroidota bacterium]
MKNYTAYLFDMDGTLVNSEPLKALALSETCGCFGKKVKPGIYKDVMGESWTNVTNHFFTHAQIKPNIDDFNTEFRKIYEELIRKELKPNPNVKKLIEKLVAKNKKIGLVSSASIWMVKQILIQLQMSEIFDIVISHEDVNNHKPDPEAYILAL